MNHPIVVLGAGMVGVCCALELQERGHAVVLVDRRAPGQETSYGNAGVLARSSIVPFNQPGLWAQLPRLLRNRGAQFRYDPGFLLRRAGWALGFVGRARRGPFLQTAQALDGLIRLSIDLHRQRLAQAGELARLRETGWVFAYRSEAAWAGGALGRETLAQFGVTTEALDPHGLHDLEPGLAPLFPRALWVRDSASVDSPGRVVAAYARLFTQRGGQILQREATGLRREGPAEAPWRLDSRESPPLAARQVVVALGPWARHFLQPLGLDVPMAWERGYHMHYAAGPGPALNRPVYDTGGAYVASPLEEGLRLTSGVELTDLDAPDRPLQLDLAEAAARQALSLGARLQEQPWRGARPTLPDSRPMIGATPGQPGLWLAFGHQHIGFSTGPGTARLLGALMDGEAPPLPAEPFAPRRFLG